MKINKFILNQLELPHEIVPGVMCYYENFYCDKTFKMEREIDNLNYIIEARKLKKKNKSDKTIYEIGFSTEELDEGITNKGLIVYNQIIDAIVELINLVSKTEKIDDIIIESSKFSSVEQMAKIKKIMQAAYKKNKYVFDGFSYSNSDGESFCIKNDVVLLDKNEGEPERLNINYCFEDWVDGSFLYEHDTALALLDYLKDKSGLAEKISKKQVDQQRANLYERTLKARFPNLNFERNGNNFVLHVDLLNKNSKTANLKKVDISDKEIEEIKQKDDLALTKVRIDLESIKKNK